MFQLVPLVVLTVFCLTSQPAAGGIYPGFGGGHIGSFGHFGGGEHLGGIGHLGGGIGHLGGGGGHLGGKPEYIILAEEDIGHGGFGGGGLGLGGSHIGHIGGGGIGHGHIGGGGIGHGHIGGGGIGHGHIGGGGGGFGGFGHGFGGEEISRGAYGGGQKNLNNEHFLKSYGTKGGELKHNGGGFNKGEELAKNVKGESGYFSDAHGGKGLFHDGKNYHGGQHFEKQGNFDAHKMDRGT